MVSPDDLLQSRYRVVQKFGKGGMGTVYKARDERLAIDVALKECHFEEPELRKQFSREAKLLARLRHPALARVIDHFEEGGGQYLVMDFVDGPDLAELLRWEPQTCTPQNVISWGEQLLDALAFLHGQAPPIIHRDIKPQNLKLWADGSIVLLDFGLAKSFAATSRITLSGSIFGYTPHYAPIEQIQGTGTDPRSDLYALGATLYHLLTRTLPPDVVTRVTATTDGLPDPLQLANAVNKEVSHGVATVIAQAMSPGKSGRYASASEMRHALRHAANTPLTAAREVATVLAASHRERLGTPQFDHRSPDEALDRSTELPAASASSVRADGDVLAAETPAALIQSLPAEEVNTSDVAAPLITAPDIQRARAASAAIPLPVVGIVVFIISWAIGVWIDSKLPDISGQMGLITLGIVPPAVSVLSGALTYATGGRWLISGAVSVLPALTVGIVLPGINSYALQYSVPWAFWYFAHIALFGLIGCAAGSVSRRKRDADGMVALVLGAGAYMALLFSWPLLDWIAGRGTIVVLLVVGYCLVGAVFALMRPRATWRWTLVLSLGAVSLGLNQDLWETSRFVNSDLDPFWLYPEARLDKADVNVPVFTVVALSLLAWIPSLAGSWLTQAVRRGAAAGSRPETE